MPHRFRNDRVIILGSLFVLGLCTGLLYLKSIRLNTLSSELNTDPAPVELSQSETLSDETQKLVAESTKHDWSSFEEARQEKVQDHLARKAGVSLQEALYFYPELLPRQSLERDFYAQNLEPELQTLKRESLAAGPREQAALSYLRLESHVESYEMGVESDPSHLSQAAQAFLAVYRNLAHLTARILESHEDPSSKSENADEADPTSDPDEEEKPLPSQPREKRMD